MEERVKYYIRFITLDGVRSKATFVGHQRPCKFVLRICHPRVYLFPHELPDGPMTIEGRDFPIRKYEMINVPWWNKKCTKGIFTYKEVEDGD